MRTTLDLNDALLVRAKAEAARRRTTLTRMIEQGLALLLAEPAPDPTPQPAFKWEVTHGSSEAARNVDWTSNAALYELAELEYDLRQAGVLPFVDPGDDAGSSGP